MEEFNLETPECIEAINSLKPSFQPKWSGEELHHYYENRKLSNKQMRAMVNYVNETTIQYIQDYPEEAKQFLNSGNAPDCPDTKVLLNINNKIDPVWEPLSADKLLERLEKITNKKWELKYDELIVDGKFLTSHSGIERLWNHFSYFGIHPEEKLDILEKLILNKLNISKQLPKVD